MPKDSVADQLEQAARFDEAFPPTIAWHEALIDTLKTMQGLTAESRLFLTNQHLAAIAKIKSKNEADDV